MTNAPTGPVCPACSKPIVSGRLVFFQHGKLFHVRCAREALGLKLGETAARSRDAKTRAGEAKGRAVRLKAMARAARLILEGRRRRSGGSPPRRRD